ncbi:MAG: hypothetical protein ABWW70_00250 [Thermoproteota archaeon]
MKALFNAYNKPKSPKSASQHLGERENGACSSSTMEAPRTSTPTIMLLPSDHETRGTAPPQPSSLLSSEKRGEVEVGCPSRSAAPSQRRSRELSLRAVKADDMLHARLYAGGCSKAS